MRYADTKARPSDKFIEAAFDAQDTNHADLQQIAEKVVGSESSVNRQATLKPDASSTRHLQVRFFGNFEVLHQGEVLRLSHNAKAAAIFRYLMANRSSLVSQDYLMGWLWPDSNLKRARWSLNSAIYTLRKLLKCEFSDVAPSGYILSENGYYRLDPTVRVVTDTEQFRAHYERANHHKKAQRKMEAGAEYEKALKLYRGDFLIEDLYEDWAMADREQYINVYIDVLCQLADYYVEIERFQDSINFCYRVLQKDRLHETCHRLLVECYACLGQQERASRQYQLLQELTASGRARIGYVLSENDP